MDWKAIFLPDVPLTEIILRGSVIYITLFVLMRIVLKRQSGGLGVTDLLLVVLIADASQNAMSGGYNSVVGGVVLVCTIVFWSYLFDWLGFKYPWFNRLTEPAPLLLVQDVGPPRGGDDREKRPDRREGAPAAGSARPRTAGRSRGDR